VEWVGHPKMQENKARKKNRGKVEIKNRKEKR
jgi:hypothetical protein